MMRDDLSQMMADQLDRLMAVEVTPKLIASYEGGEEAGSFEAALSQLGLALALVPEEAGGAGLGWRDIGPALQTLGYHAAPTDLGDRIAANRLLAMLGQAPSETPPPLALDRLELDRGAVHGSAFVARRNVAGAVLAQAGDRLCLVDAANAESRALDTIGRMPAALVEFAGAPVIASAPLPGAGPIELAALIRAAQISGALSRLLEMSIDYGNTRVQFGRPIGKFQAVQHLIARLAGEAGCTRAAVELAFAALDAGLGWEGVAIAKARSSRAVTPGADSAHQVHGAIGVTQEHALHFFTRRLWQWREEAGNEHVWSERLGHAVLDRGAEGLWPAIVELSGTTGA